MRGFDENRVLDLCGMKYVPLKNLLKDLVIFKVVCKSRTKFIIS